MGLRVARQYVSIIFISFVVPVFSNSALAKGEQFDYEINAAYLHSEDEQSIFENDNIQIGLSIFDQPVGYGDYPYLLTNFFERRAHLDFIYVNSESDSVDDELSADFLRLNYSYASVGYPILFNLGAGRFMGDGTDAVGDYDYDAMLYNFGIGYYISPNSVANIEIIAIDHKISDDTNPDIEYDETQLEATWQHVLKVDANQYISVLLDVEASEIGSSKNSKVGATFDYYISKKVGFGIGYAAYRGDYAVTEGGELALNASVFADRQLGFTAELAKLYADESGSDEDSFMLKAIARFD